MFPSPLKSSQVRLVSPWASNKISTWEGFKEAEGLAIGKEMMESVSPSTTMSNESSLSASNMHLRFTIEQELGNDKRKINLQGSVVTNSAKSS